MKGAGLQPSTGKASSTNSPVLCLGKMGGEITTVPIQSCSLLGGSESTDEGCHGAHEDLFPHVISAYDQPLLQGAGTDCYHQPMLPSPTKPLWCQPAGCVQGMCCKPKSGQKWK